ncbi:hypothetical protein [Kiloniella sp. b19]|uniref:hypothetical protein n=1 Tax=Kiloniella sp. GXU_MW_B19 TaxID=3141326 RepID=UPI0031E43E70
MSTLETNTSDSPEIPELDDDSLYCKTDEAGFIHDGKGETHTILGLPISRFINQKLHDFVVSQDHRRLDELLRTQLAQSESTLNIVTAEQWEEPFRVSVTKLALEATFTTFLQRLPLEQGGGAVLQAHVVDEYVKDQSTFLGDLAEDDSLYDDEHKPLETLAVSMFEVANLSNPDLVQTHGEETINRLKTKVKQNIVRDGTRPVTQIDEERYAVLHDGSYNSDHVEKSLKRQVEESGLSKDISVGHLNQGIKADNRQDLQKKLQSGLEGFADEGLEKAAENLTKSSKPQKTAPRVVETAEEPRKKSFLKRFF